MFIQQQFAAMFTGLQLSVDVAGKFGLKVRVGDMHHQWPVEKNQRPRPNQGYYKVGDVRNVTLPPPLILARKAGDEYTLKLGIRNALGSHGSYWGLYPNTSYGYYDPSYCTAEDRKWCYRNDYFPDQHRKEARTTLVELAQTRRLSQVTPDSGCEVGPEQGRRCTLIKRGTSLTGEESARCDTPNLRPYYPDRSPPPQKGGWARMFWYDFPMSHQSWNSMERWRAIMGYPAGFYKNCQGCFGGSTSIVPYDLCRWIPCDSLYNMWGNALHQGPPYFTPPNEYLLGRWSFANTIFCNNKEAEGNSGQWNKYDGDSDYDFKNPWRGAGDEKEFVGFGLEGLWPKAYLFRLDEGNCTIYVKQTWGKSDQWIVFLSLLAMDAGRGAVSAAKNVARTVESIAQGVGSVIWAAVAWIMPFVIAVGVLVTLGLLRALGILGFAQIGLRQFAAALKMVVCRVRGGQPPAQRHI